MKTLPQWLKEFNLTISMSEGRRCIAMGGVKLNGEPVTDISEEHILKVGDVIQVGKSLTKEITEEDL